MAEKKTKTGLGWNFLNFFTPKSFLPKEIKLRQEDDLGDSIVTVPWYKNRNDFSLLLNRSLEVSPTHRSCIHTKSDYVVGDGFTLTVGSGTGVMVTKTKKQTNTVPSDDVINDVSTYVKDINSDRDNLCDIVRKININWEAFGIVWTEEIRGIVAGKKFYHINVIDSPKVLFKGGDNADGSEVYVSPDWSPDYISTNKPEAIKINEWVKDKNEVERRIACFKFYAPLRETYSVPPSIASLLFTHLELEIPSHNLERFMTDFMPKVFMQFFVPDGMTDTEKKKFYEDLQKTYTRKGGQRRSLFAQIVESKHMETNVHEFGEQSDDGDFLGLTDKVEHVIFKSHQWHPLLAGVPTPAGLGNSNLVMNVFHLYNQCTIIPRQRLIMSKIINPIFQRSAEWLGTSWKDHSLNLSTSVPIAFVGQLNVNKMFTKDEGRGFLGQPKMVDEEKGNELIDGGTPVNTELSDPSSTQPDQDDQDDDKKKQKKVTKEKGKKESK